MSPGYRIAKRTLDFTLATAGLIALAPVWLAIAVAIRIAMGAPVLFRQERPGLDERPFTLVKFRTMRAGSAADGERLTALGAFLRKSSLDEIPQLWNVCKGEMSLVGPRPLLPRYVARYNAFQRRRHEVPPGITGWAQINGRNALTWERKFALDVWYVDHASFWLDARILWRTPWEALRGTGISQHGHATMPEFFGSAEMD